MSSQPDTFLSPAEYLDIERKAEYRSEYYQGEMFAMAGASRAHSFIVTNLAGELRQRLKGRPCEVHSTDMRLQVRAAGLYTYPDVMVICSKAEFADNGNDTVLNPVLIIEVLSESTKDYDLGRKFERYRTLSSLMEYVTVAQDRPRVQRSTREAEDRWVLQEFSDPGGTVRLESAGCELPMTEIYYKIEFPTK